MGKQAVMASVMGAALNLQAQSTGYIDASSIAGAALGNFRVFLKGTAGTPYNFPDSVAAGAPLIEAIQEISSSATKVTKIDIEFETAKSRRGDPLIQYSGNISIWIDWASKPLARVKWSGLYSGEYAVGAGSNARGIVFGIYQGDEAISAVGNSTVQMQNTDFQNDQRGGPTLTLEVDTNRNIVKLPIFYSGTNRTPRAGLDAVSYTITTDDGINVTAAPTPPAETPTVAPVVGVKISELNAVDALQDDDLFVLSQDNASDGTYDTSYNVTLAGLRTNIAGGTSSVVMLAPSASEDAGDVGATLNLTDYSIPAGAKQLIVGCHVGSAQGTSTISIGSTSAVLYIGGTSRADGDGDSVRNYNQGIYPINQADNTIYIKRTSTATFSPLAQFNIVGYIT
jgi:hypothetical protein